MCAGLYGEAKPCAASQTGCQLGLPRGLASFKRTFTLLTPFHVPVQAVLNPCSILCTFRCIAIKQQQQTHPPLRKQLAVKPHIHESTARSAGSNIKQGEVHPQLKQLAWADRQLAWACWSQRPFPLVT